MYSIPRSKFLNFPHKLNSESLSSVLYQHELSWGWGDPGICFCLNTLRPSKMAANGLTTFSNAFSWMKKNIYIFQLIEISLKIVRNGPINHIPALVQIMAWHRLGDKPLSEPMTVSLQMHICVTRPQWVKPKLTTPINLCSKSVLIFNILFFYFNNPLPDCYLWCWLWKKSVWLKPLNFLWWLQLEVPASSVAEAIFETVQTAELVWWPGLAYCFL